MTTVQKPAPPPPQVHCSFEGRFQHLEACLRQQGWPTAAAATMLNTFISNGGLKTSEKMKLQVLFDLSKPGYLDTGTYVEQQLKREVLKDKWCAIEQEVHQEILDAMKKIDSPFDKENPLCWAEDYRRERIRNETIGNKTPAKNVNEWPADEKSRYDGDAKAFIRVKTEASDKSAARHAEARLEARAQLTRAVLAIDYSRNRNIDLKILNERHAIGSRERDDYERYVAARDLLKLGEELFNEKCRLKKNEELLAKWGQIEDLRYREHVDHYTFCLLNSGADDADRVTELVDFHTIMAERKLDEINKICMHIKNLPRATRSAKWSNDFSQSIWADAATLIDRPEKSESR
ncbi:hypothetical protein [Variovorax saccharolyticus]|uniref:hypothetical protein n=1 Tax=Variovorax saccharolyticus TaxID=3053516 RepID=UPI0025773D09|nr:hypothetical protein [Variovorax sp. J31P216]MDM0030203.1 hypothetical protein [Variovorax sp. J31P216]